MGKSKDKANIFPSTMARSTRVVGKKVKRMAKALLPTKIILNMKETSKMERKMAKE
jgi:hypothetical protein